MKASIIIAALTALLPPALPLLAADEAPAPIYAKGETGLRVESITCIWCEGEHNAFPDLEFFDGKWFAATREGTAHGIAGFGRVRIIASEDGKAWRSVATFDDFGDYRRAELSITADGRLMVLSKFNFYEKAAADENKSYAARDHQGGEHRVKTAGAENRVAFSSDGETWSKMQAVKGTRPGAWFYSGVQWREGTGYAIDRQGRQLYRTKDGVEFQAVSDVPVGNESRISFLPDGTMIVFFRNGSLATSPPPYETWSLNETNKLGPHSYGGPGVIALASGEVYAASRHRIDVDDFDFPDGENVFPDGTVLFKLEGKRLVPRLLIRGGGDRGYNGVVFRDGRLYMAYNAPSREAGRSCIYLAIIKLM